MPTSTILPHPSAPIVDDSGRITTEWYGKFTDLYQEGTFTPVLTGDSTAGTQTYSTQVGEYIKIGRLCHVCIRLIMTAKGGTTAGSITITGLPFTSENNSDANFRQALALGSFGNFDLTAGYTFLGARAQNNAAILELIQSGDNVGALALPAAGLLAASSITIAGTYITA